jgi:histidine kinase
LCYQNEKEKAQMKKITLLAASALLLLTACGQVESGPPEIAPATVVQGDVQQPQSTPDPTMTVQEPDTASGVVQEQPQEKKAQQTEAAPPAAVTPEPVEEPTEDIPSETVHAKTGYVEPQPTPEPELTPEPAAPADRQAAIDAANAYAVLQYGVVTDRSLTLDNSAYRFPAAVPVGASQETLEAKARDMVDFTFRQLMMQTGRDSVADAGFHCNVCIVEDGGSLLIYVLYDG